MSLKYLFSYPSLDSFEESSKKEIAFIGRSNVGKSSLINSLCGVKNTARTSNVTGKTRNMNVYSYYTDHLLIDFPGYGYAKFSKEKRAHWKQTILNYLIKREALWCAVIIIDSRHEFQENDLFFLDYLGKEKIPFLIVFNKIDKIKNKVKKKESIEITLKSIFEPLPKIYYCSAEKNWGTDLLHKALFL